VASSNLYRQLVPDAPLHKRTDRDVYPSAQAEARVRLAGRLAPQLAQPGLQKPSLISSWEGTIDTLLLAFPSYGVASKELSAGYKSVINALRQGTRFVVVHHASREAEVQKWFQAADHPDENVTFVALPDYVSFTDWAEDGYVALLDAADDTAYLMEPWEFPRAGDALIAESVQEHVSLRSAQAPLIFQGGNCLIGDTFWLLGKDYFADSVALLAGASPPVEAPEGTTPDAFVTQLFGDYVDAERELIVVGTNRPIPVNPFYGTREGDEYYVDIAGDGAGTYQPIFHIDMFITLVGRNPQGAFEVLVGSPALGDELLGTRSPFALNDVYDTLAGQLADRGMEVQRNPLVHRPTQGRSFTLAQLREIAGQPGNEAIGQAVAELQAAGAAEETTVQVRTWHHVTWNNCLVENSATVGPNVYLPTFGHRPNTDLRVIDEAMKSLWEDRGFTVHLLGDFNAFASRQGVVHCIKKYLGRGG
jgi:hypothetical protein